MSELMEHFSNLLADEEQINAQIAIAMKQICESARIGRSEFESTFTGITYATWRNYLNPAYKNSRSVAVLAALSWYTGVSMNSFYLGEKLCAFLGVSQEGLRLLTLISQLHDESFEIACQMAFGLIDEDKKDVVRESYLKARLLHREIAGICRFPRPLDLNSFSQDYKRSCAVGICRLQNKLGYSDAQMADILGVSQHRYIRLSDPEDELPIPVFVAVRFKVKFQLKETSFILDDMSEYPDFAHLRRFQDARDRIIRPLLEHLSSEAAARLHRALLSLFW